MSKRTTIILDDDALVILNDPINLSLAINTSVKDASAYKNTLSYLAAHLLPELTDAEWKAVLSTYSGRPLKERFTRRPYRIASDMLNDFGEVDLSNLLPEQAEIIKKIHALTQPQQFALLEFVDYFWSKKWESASDFSTIKQVFVTL